jgi:hypothetical protein
MKRSRRCKPPVPLKGRDSKKPNLRAASDQGIKILNSPTWKVAAVQMDCRLGDTRSNLQVIRERLRASGLPPTLGPVWWSFPNAP